MRSKIRTRLRLDRYRSASKNVVAAPALSKSGDGIQVIFINYRGFGGASGVHIFHLANALYECGITASVSVPSRPGDTHRFGNPTFVTRSYLSQVFRACFSRAQYLRGQTLIHAWTPREPVRRLTAWLSRKLNAPYVVHLEDNEQYLADKMVIANRPLRRGQPAAEEKSNCSRFADPEKHRIFIAGAAGVTCVNERLKEFCPENLSPLVITPACEERVFALSPCNNQALRDELGITKEEFVLLYPGNVHLANFREIEALYRAVAQLSTSGRRVRLVRIGDDANFFNDCSLREKKSWLLQIDVQEKSIPDYLEIADALVQPGKENIYNAYRFPSKLPMFLASGRPVVLPEVDFGLSLTDEENCLLLRDGNSGEISQKIQRLMGDAHLRRKLGENGREYARRNFSWKTTARTVANFYDAILRDVEISGTTI